MTQYHNADSEGKKIAAGQESDLRVGYAGAYELWTISAAMRQYTAQRPEADVQFVLRRKETPAVFGYSLRTSYRSRNGWDWLQYCCLQNVKHTHYYSAKKS